MHDLIPVFDTPLIVYVARVTATQKTKIPRTAPIVFGALKELLEEHLQKFGHDFVMRINGQEMLCCTNYCGLQVNNRLDGSHTKGNNPGKYANSSGALQEHNLFTEELFHCSYVEGVWLSVC